MLTIQTFALLCSFRLSFQIDTEDTLETYTMPTDEHWLRTQTLRLMTIQDVLARQRALRNANIELLLSEATQTKEHPNLRVADQASELILNVIVRIIPMRLSAGERAALAESIFQEVIKEDAWAYMWNKPLTLEKKNSRGGEFINRFYSRSFRHQKV